MECNGMRGILLLLLIWSKS